MVIMEALPVNQEAETVVQEEAAVVLMLRQTHSLKFIVFLA